MQHAESMMNLQECHSGASASSREGRWSTEQCIVLDFFAQAIKDIWMTVLHTRVVWGVIAEVAVVIVDSDDGDMGKGGVCF